VSPALQRAHFESAEAVDRWNKKLKGGLLKKKKKKKREEGEREKKRQAIVQNKLSCCPRG